jgi:hypothetical protein
VTIRLSVKIAVCDAAFDGALRGYLYISWSTSRIAARKILNKRVLSHSLGDRSLEGFCLACGAEASDGCEPDAEQYECESCGEHAVYGAEEILIAIA